MPCDDTVELRPWSEGDFFVLERINAPEQMRHLGRPESEEQLRVRHARYLADATPGRTRMFTINCQGQACGSIGFWERVWLEQTVYETGWQVFTEFQGKGVAKAAAASLIAVLRAERVHRYLHAFPAPDNHASNAICRRLGFEHLGDLDFEYPKGHRMISSNWRLDLAG